MFETCPRTLDLLARAVQVRLNHLITDEDLADLRKQWLKLWRLCLQRSAGMEGSMEPSRRALGVQLAKLAAPMVLSNLAYTLLGVLDTLFLGRVSTAAVGAIGVAGSLFLAFALLFRGLIQGTLPYVARMYGSQRPQNRKYLKHFALLSLL